MEHLTDAENDVMQYVQKYQCYTLTYGGDGLLISAIQSLAKRGYFKKGTPANADTYVLTQKGLMALKQ